MLLYSSKHTPVYEPLSMHVPDRSRDVKSNCANNFPVLASDILCIHFVYTVFLLQLVMEKYQNRQFHTK